jgi:hypothetical protein
MVKQVRSLHTLEAAFSYGRNYKQKETDPRQGALLQPVESSPQLLPFFSYYPISILKINFKGTMN